MDPKNHLNVHLLQIILFSFCLQIVDSGAENLISDRESNVINSRYKRNIVDVEILDFSHDPTKCAKDKTFVWCVQPDYNREKHPYAYFHMENRSLPLQYDFNFVIDEISNINDKSQTLSFAMYFAVSWTEPRLEINESSSAWTEEKTGPKDQVNESPENLKYLWYPELEIYGLETFGRQRVLKEMSGVRIMKNKTINYELGVRVTISCKMIFDDYPLDSHQCQFQVGSYYDTIETVTCSSQFIYNTKRQRSLQHYISIQPLSRSYSVVDLPSGHYAACGFQVNLQRKQMQYQIQVYLPSFMFVVTSWVSFLIKPEVVPGRMALLVTLFLVLINIFNSVREQAPISSRLNAVDLYLVVCVFFVFSALMEYAAILLLLKKRRRPTRKVDEGLATVLQLSLTQNNENGDINPQRPQRRKAPASASGDPRLSEHKQALCDNIDAWALWVSPPVFLLFNCIYWIVYT